MQVRLLITSNGPTPWYDGIWVSAADTVVTPIPATNPPYGKVAALSLRSFFAIAIILFSLASAFATDTIILAALFPFSFAKQSATTFSI